MAAVPTNQNVKSTLEMMAAHVNLAPGGGGGGATVQPPRYIKICLQRAAGRDAATDRGIAPPNRIPYSLKVTKAPPAAGGTPTTQSSDMLLTNERGEIEIPESLIARAESADETILTIWGSDISLRRIDLVKTLPGAPTPAQTAANDLRNGRARLQNLGYLHGTFTSALWDNDLDVDNDSNASRQACLHFQADQTLSIDGVLVDVLAKLKTVVGE
jgi:hypothetical protein